MTTTSTLVSAEELTPSLGSLLRRFRASTGESAKDVRRRCSLGLVDIVQLELSRADLDAAQLSELVAAYGVPRVRFPAGRSLVRVDLVAGTVSVDHSDSVIAETAGDLTLLCFLELLCAERGASATLSVSFRELDLNVLRLVLSSRRDDVIAHLELLCKPLSEKAPELVRAVAHRILSSRNEVLLLAAVLVLLAAAVVLLAGGIAWRKPRNTSPAIVPAPTEILEPLVVVRGPDGTPVVSQPAPS
jgi:hypothetical protein